MREQEYDTREETYAKISIDANKIEFKKKENKQKKKYQATIVGVVILNVIDVLFPFGNFRSFIGILTNVPPITVLTFSFVRVRKLFMKY